MRTCDRRERAAWLFTVGRASLILALLVTGCAAHQSPPSEDPAQPKTRASRSGNLPALRPLGEATAFEFRDAFDEAKGKTRFIVALSPT